jgi:Helix-turn-helix domain
MRRFAGARRFVFNKALALQQQRYKRGEKRLSHASMCKLLTGRRKAADMHWLADVHSQVLQQALKDLERAYADVDVIASSGPDVLSACKSSPEKENEMQRTVHVLACSALIALLTACVFTPRPRTSAAPSHTSATPPRPRPQLQPQPQPPQPQQPQPQPQPQPNPNEAAIERYGQVNERIDHLNQRVDGHVSAGSYAAADGNALHHRLDVIREEAHEIAAQHNGGLSGDEEGVLNQELDTAARAIGE